MPAESLGVRLGPVDPKLASAMARKYSREGRGKIRPGPTEKVDLAGKRWVTYCRVSSDEQEEEGFSLEAQARETEARVAEQGGVLVRLPEDVPPWDTTTGTVFDWEDEQDRQRLRWLYENPQAWDIVVFKRRDRLHRNIINTARWMGWCIEKGKDMVELVSNTPDGVLDTRTPMGRICMMFGAGLAEMEVEAIVQRTMSGRDQLVRQGFHGVGRRAPYGITWTKPSKKDPSMGGGSFIADTTVDPDTNLPRCETVVQIFKRRGEGAALHDIAVWLGKCGCLRRHPPSSQRDAELTWGSIAPARETTPGKRVKGARRLRSGPRRYTANGLYNNCPGMAFVRRVLKNPTYYGVLPWKVSVSKDGEVRGLYDATKPVTLLRTKRGEVVEYRWDYTPLITKEQFDAAQRRLPRVEVQVRMSAEMKAWLDAEAKKRRCPMSALVRDAMLAHASSATPLRATDKGRRADRFWVSQAALYAVDARLKALDLGGASGRGRGSIIKGCLEAAMRNAGASAPSSAVPASGVRA